MYTKRAGLQVAVPLLKFIENDALPGTGIDASRFWQGVADIFNHFSEDNRALLEKRQSLQAQIDAWHLRHEGEPINQPEYQDFLTSIGYLVKEPSPFHIGTKNVDAELSSLAGPQLVVPARNTRFVLNAANARWGSLYDALYGTDVIPGRAAGNGYDAIRGAQVIAEAKAFLDKTVPLASGKHANVDTYRVKDGMLSPALAHQDQFAGFRGDPNNPEAVILQNNGLHIEIVIARETPVGRTDPAGVADILLEAALSTIVDLEDSVAAVDADDKVEGYANWLGLILGNLEATFTKNGHQTRRSLNSDRGIIASDGKQKLLNGRSLLLVRNVGHLMQTSALLLEDGSEAFEGILDAIVTSLISLQDLKGKTRFGNSRTGSIYIVKPKMHGPEEAAFTDRLFAAVEDLMGLDRHVIKIGVMDEERRTSANLAACIKAVSNRIFFINTGFLDRTGDEIHTAMQAGPMVLKENMKRARWISAYEDRNVQIGLACGFSKVAQIGKGMWAAPDNMAEMMAQKIGHPMSGATTAWVPSPTAATLHAMHYHDVNVFERHAKISSQPIAALSDLLTIPLAEERNWPGEIVVKSLENNIQGILGYVVRWIDQGIGCSKVPDYDNVNLMEDRATLRISSQHVANWLLHGVCSPEQVEAAFLRMAEKVDLQNKEDPLYQPMAINPESNIAFQAARALVFQGIDQPNGYTEPLLHEFRIQRKNMTKT